MGGGLEEEEPFFGSGFGEGVAWVPGLGELCGFRVALAGIEPAGGVVGGGEFLGERDFWAG